jgi:disulfide bond formation protein DsbB
MSELISTVNLLISSFTLGSHIIIGLVLLSLIFLGKNSGPVEFLKKHALLLVFLVSLGATAISLFYSNFAGYAPCNLCWWQRVFMYSVFVVSGVALCKKDDNADDYILTLALVGGLIALYHTYIQYGGSPLIPCAANVEAVSCSQRFIFEYNYITIPLMSLTGFVMIGVALVLKKITSDR